MTDEQAPEGYVYEWVVDADWQMLPADELRECAMKGCTADAVATLRRGHRRFRSGYAWWPYCEQHLYGRKIEDGAVKFRRLVKPGGDALRGGRDCDEAY